MLPEVGGTPGRGLTDTLREAARPFPDPARGTWQPFFCAVARETPGLMRT